jgi:hypothetical protein
VEVHLLGQPESVPAYLDEVPRGDEGIEMTLERSTLVAWNLEKLEELADAGRVMDPLAHPLEDLFG